jgi:peptidoglycan-N-acetylglucosamine deacetylase
MSMVRTARAALIAGSLAVIAACGASAPAPGAAPGMSATPGSTTPNPAGSGTPSTQPVTRSTSLAARPEPSTSHARSAAPPITGWLAGHDWTYIPTRRHVVALTFDAGANADAVPSILATLRREHVPATFFFTGNFVRDYPATARAIAADGFRIGDHTISHPHLTHLADAVVRREILGAAEMIMAATGANPVPLFRFPFGDADARTLAIANRLGYVPVRWTVDTLGWEGTAGHISASVVAARVLAGLRPGEIVLMHVGSNPDDHTTFDADALPRVISELRAHGYSFVTLDALTG